MHSILPWHWVHNTDSISANCQYIESGDISWRWHFSMRDRQWPSLITHSPPPFPIMNRDQISLHISIPSTLPPVHAEVRWIIRALASLRAPGWPNCWTLPSGLARACNRYISQRARHLFFSIAGNLWAIWKRIHVQIFLQKMLECTQDMKQTQFLPWINTLNGKGRARNWPR